MPTQAERLAALEAERPFIKEKLESIDSKVDTLIAAHNRQAGIATVLQLLYGAVCASLALFGEWLVNNWHDLVRR